MKTALIIGGSSGIGQALAWDLAHNNIDKVIVVGRNETSLLKTKEKYPSKIEYIKADIAQKPDLDFIVTQISPNIDFLILNAATEEPVMSFEKISLTDFQATLSTNVTANFYLIQQLLLQQKLSGDARILFVSSGLDRCSMPGLLAYGISKSALYYLSQALKNESVIKSKKINIGICNPGVTDTLMQKRLRTNLNNPTRQAFEQFYKLDQLRSPIEIAQFFNWILLETPSILFTEIYWDIDKNTIEKAWKKNNLKLLTKNINTLKVDITLL